MAPHSSTLAWKIPWMEEPGALQSMGSLGVGHNWVTSLSLFTFMIWRRKWQRTPVLLPWESQGWGSLVGCHLRGHTESDTTEVTKQQQCSFYNAMITTKKICVFIKILKKDVAIHNGNTYIKMTLRPNVHVWTSHKISLGKWWKVSYKPQLFYFAHWHFITIKGLLYKFMWN